MKKQTIHNFAGIILLTAAAAMSAAPVIQPLTVIADTIITNTPAQGTVTVTKQDTSVEHNPVAGAEYTAYKIMTLTPGANAGDYASYSVVNTYHSLLEGITADNLGNYSAVEIEALLKDLEVLSRSDTNGIKFPLTAADGTTTQTLDTGWYLIVETATPSGAIAGMPFLAAIPSTNNITTPDGTETVGTEWIYNISAVPKSPTVSVDKNIMNGKGSKDSTFVIEDTVFTGKNDTAAVGDYVNYAVNTTVPEYGDSFFHNDTAPTFEFKDTMSIGLTIQNDTSHPVTVTIDDNEVPATNYTLSAVPADADTASDLTLTFGKGFLQNPAYRGKEMTISYYAKVNENAVMGSAGNTNDVVLSFSDKPDTITSASPVTDAPDTYVYTYGICVDKFAENTAAALSGAKFKLFTDAALTTAVKGGDGEEIQTTDSNGALSFPRIDAGTYYLKEVESPSGYSLLTNPIKVEIIPTADEEGRITNGNFTLKVDGKEVTITEGSHVTRLSATEGTATVAVQNRKGFSLPATGGSGLLLIITISAAGLLTVTFFMLKQKKQEE